MGAHPSSFGNQFAPESNAAKFLSRGAQSSVFSGAPKGLLFPGDANAPLGANDQSPSRAEVLHKLAIVAEASRIAAVESGEEMSRLLDPRAVDIRSAAMGRYAPARRRARPGR